VTYIFDSVSITNKKCTETILAVAKNSEKVAYHLYPDMQYKMRNAYQSWSFLRYQLNNLWDLGGGYNHKTSLFYHILDKVPVLLMDL